MVVLVVSGGGLRCFGWGGRAAAVAMILVQVLARDGAQGEVQIPEPSLSVEWLGSWWFWSR